MKLVNQLSSVIRGTSTLAAHGFPSPLLMISGGIGDQFYLTTVAKSWLEQKGERASVLTDHPELFLGNHDVAKVVKNSHPVWRMAPLIAGGKELHYGGPLDANPPGEMPQEHILSLMCKSIGLKPPEVIRPYLYLTDEERAFGEVAQGLVAIQSSGIAARWHMKNKEWGAERFQRVVDALQGEVGFIQVGSAKDPPLSGALDYRGKTSIRQTAALLSHARGFVGLAGFPMHIAQSVDCRSVVVFGGREKWWQTGYESNLNLETSPPCSPCWFENRCEFDRRCMTEISETTVIEAIQTLVGNR